jgi:hypothetical protein
VKHGCLAHPHRGDNQSWNKQDEIEGEDGCNRRVSLCPEESPAEKLIKKGQGKSEQIAREIDGVLPD